MLHYNSLVDIRRFVTYGLMNGYLRRAFTYPIYLGRNGQRKDVSSALVRYMDGTKHVDEIALILESSLEDVLQILLETSNVVLLKK